MKCYQCQGIEELFNEEEVARDLDRYHKKGPDKTTTMLINAIKAAHLQKKSLLDIGGGVGAIQHALVNAGVEQVTDIDASRAYLKAAKNEAQRRGIAEKIRFTYGNFVDLADQIQPTDIVTLDRVICCYDDMRQLVSLSAARARQLYGVVYPRDLWWIRIGMKVLNLYFRLKKSNYRSFVHSSREVEALVMDQGLKRRYYGQTMVWQVVVYARD